MYVHIHTYVHSHLLTCSLTQVLPEAVPDVVSLLHEYLILALLRRPTSVWADGPMYVVDQHISRVLRYLLGPREFLTHPKALAAVAAHSLDAYVAAFRKFFASSLTHHGGGGSEEGS